MAQIDLPEEEDVAEVLRAAGEASVGGLKAGEDVPDPTSVRTMAIRAALGEQTSQILHADDATKGGLKSRPTADKKDAVLNRKFPTHYADLKDYQYSRLEECPSRLLSRYQSQAYQVEDWPNAVIFQQMLLDLGCNKMPGLIFLAKALEMTGRVQQAIDVRLEIAGFGADQPLNNAAIKRLNYEENDYDATLPADYMKLTKEQLESIAKFSTGRLLLYAKAAWLDKRSLRHVVLFKKTLLARPGYNGPHNPNGVITTKIHLAMAYQGLGFLDDALTLQYELRDIHRQSNPNHAKIIARLEDLIRNKKLRTAKASKTASR